MRTDQGPSTHQSVPTPDGPLRISSSQAGTRSAPRAHTAQEQERLLSLGRLPPDFGAGPVRRAADLQGAAALSASGPGPHDPNKILRAYFILV